MREFIVILRSGVRFVVKADRVFSDNVTVTFVVLFAPALVAPVVVGSPLGTEWPKAAAQRTFSQQLAPVDPGVAETVAVFNQQEVVAVLSREHLVSEAARGNDVRGSDDAIPF
jgi:hypothetical protein